MFCRNASVEGVGGGVDFMLFHIYLDHPLNGVKCDDGLTHLEEMIPRKIAFVDNLDFVRLHSVASISKLGQRKQNKIKPRK